MACAHAKFTGEVGVCMATSGPGAIHLLNGLYDAKLDHQPVVAIVGQQARTALGGDYQQEVDLVSLFKDVAGAFVHMARSPRRFAIWSTARCASPGDERTPTCDHRPQRRAGAGIRSERRRGPTARCTPASGIAKPRRRARRRASSSAPPRCSTPGSGSRSWSGPARCTPPTRSSRSRSCSAPGWRKALLGKAVLPDDLPWVTGSIGLLGTRPSWELMERLRHAVDGRLELPVLGVSAEAKGRRAACRSTSTGGCSSMRYPMEVNLVGDAAQTLRALLPFLQRKKRPLLAWGDRGERRALVDGPGGAGDDVGRPDQPSAGVPGASSAAAGRLHPRRDSGSGANWYARDLKIPTRHDALALGHAGVNGQRRSLRDRGQDRALRTGR